MQTFLPLKDFKKSAEILDYRRLGKQRVEVLQLLKALSGETKGWVNHPATRMWKGHINSLVEYGEAMCNEWISRGYKDTCLDKIKIYKQIDTPTVNPRWLGNKEFHASHRSNLLRKKLDYYYKFGWTESPGLPYIWPE